MIQFVNKDLKCPEGGVFKGTCGSYFKVLHKCNKDTYLAQRMGFWASCLHRLCLKLKQ